MKMEPQDTIFCYDKKEEKCNKKNCLGIVAIILALAFTFVIGLLIGAALALVILLSLPAVIVLAVILGLLLILTIILMFCNRRRTKKCKCCC